MTIEITAPETEAMIARYLQTGKFQSVDELLAKALVALREKEPVNASPNLSNRERRKLEGRKSLVELFAESPFKGLDIEFDESAGNEDFGRDIKL
jgi:Arc/MetJ-type ribon-helix-helix transcriptional regulator